MSVIDRSKPIVVFLAAGVQGGAVARAALSRGLKVRALVRDRKRVPGLNLAGIELAEGDLHDVASLGAASADIDHAVLQLPIGSTDEMKTQAENALAAFTAMGVRSFILKLASASRPLPCEEPSFVANQMIEDAARRAGLPFAIVRPTMYLDNLLKPSARVEIMERGVFAPPIPATQRIAWTSVDDCAEAALMLLERGAMGGDYRIAGPESLTGDELASRVSIGIGRTFVYHGQPLDEFEREVDVAMGAGVGRRVASKFRYFAAHSDDADTILAAPFRPQVGLEGFTPTAVASWALANRDNFNRAGDTEMSR
ncbi:nucleoside-diphosphate sugar epimerase [Bradyrhizobium sp. NAS80.1]|uniref:SDR family oxidoreductase n=1 Tax=Bradyrhizobium sp. NAS80.1 TaxID=1680159 RepID=UPI0009630401|nr:NmrA family NAD(P)-binding protein [Bradyrhizobium sp. NAS80.1]OKO72663.1 nucleoside-diphosphate sugar epimerase [Bradyrhizobium sp. NAS80.1]